MKTASWVITDATGRALFETFDARIAASINTGKYRVIPIAEYLGNLNRQIRDGQA